MGAYFHYLHAVLIGGIIVVAVGMDLLLENPWERAEGARGLVMMLGPMLYLLATALYRWVATRRVARAQAVGAVVLAGLAVVGHALPMLELGWLGTAILLVVSWRRKPLTT